LLGVNEDTPPLKPAGLRRAPQGAPLDQAECDDLRVAVERFGERDVSAAIGVTPTTLARALARLGLHRGTRALFREGLGPLRTRIAEHR
jgi:predicted TIM-barrel fold metal-dependent hydrolase